MNKTEQQKRYITLFGDKGRNFGMKGNNKVVAVTPEVKKVLDLMKDSLEKIYEVEIREDYKANHVSFDDILFGLINYYFDSAIYDDEYDDEHFVNFKDERNKVVSKIFKNSEVK